jgi:hypothetical protein
MKPKMITLGTDRVLDEKEAAELYELQKRSAPHAAQEDIVTFFMERSGNPEPAFVSKVNASRDAYLQYVSDISAALKDDQYCDMFYNQTGKVIVISSDHVDAWAGKIAEAVLKQSQNPG